MLGWLGGGWDLVLGGWGRVERAPSSPRNAPQHFPGESFWGLASRGPSHPPMGRFRLVFGMLFSSLPSGERIFDKTRKKF
uniref:Uncharacterized protein n=1 Tax=Candidatus Kentrum sp. UNK TaxID=2126344 RepID=A0A451B1G2_9GAMM|nr:MAG: hypothetical protein BECKUNK1418G_GA0071005_11016 [Candidatus Kentron sp. UNK]VFK72122.1 MAG: hypothetical protein BECKUNK1418H_GA0071006_10976 [Candidatus Kentron sp. UNK]